MNIEPGRIINDFIEPNKRQYIVTIDGAEYVLHSGDELFIPKGSVQGGSVKAGTRSIHAFDGQRVKG